MKAAFDVEQALILIPCDICGESDLEFLFTKPGVLTGYPFRIVRCPECEYMMVDPRLTEKGINDLYDSEYYEGKGFDPAVRHMQEYELEDDEMKSPASQTQNFIRMLNEVAPPPATLLDYGCGLGDFMRQANAAGYKSVGFEVSDFAGKFARSKGHTVFDRPEDLPREQFDIVTSIEVLEHCFAPMDALQTVYSCLKLGGLFFYSTYNFDGYYQNWKKRRKDKQANSYIMPEGHINFFSSKAMRKCLTQIGFSQVFDFEPKCYIKAGRIYKMLRDMRLIDGSADAPRTASERAIYYGVRKLFYLSGTRRPLLPLARK